MSFGIVAPHYSFVQLGDQESSECVVNVGDCLPINDIQRLAFQLFVNDPPTPSEGCSIEYLIYPFPSSQQCDNLSAGHPQWPAIFYPKASKYTNTVGNDLTIYFDLTGYSWNDFKDSGIDEGDCFRFVLFYADKCGDTYTNFVPIYCTNCFVRRQSCYDSIVSYVNNTDAFGFQARGGASQLPNIIQLPLFLNKPQNPTDETSYLKSDNTRILVSSRVDQEWGLETDSMGADFHQKLNMALRVSNVAIISEYANALLPNLQQQLGFIKVVVSEKYEIEWTDSPSFYALAKGKAKVKNAFPVSMINNNC